MEALKQLSCMDQAFMHFMREVLSGSLRRLANQIDPQSALPTEPIDADPYVVSSLLQKSICRGERQIAERAALTFFKMRGSSIWRRFMGIAFEDIGIGRVDAVTMTVAAGSDAAFRKSCGGDIRVAVHLATMLADAPKDRSADYLFGAKDHPALAGFGQAMANAPIEAKSSSVRDKTLPLTHRAVAACFGSGLGSRGEGAKSKGDLDALLTAFRELGVPEDLVVATGIAARRTREPITVMVMLVWLAATVSQQRRVCDCPIPPFASAGDVPLYALDQHTRLGRDAIWRFACANDSVRTCLERFVPASGRRRAANVAAFYVDGAPVARRLVWDKSESLESFGIERDLLIAGVTAEGIGPLIETMRANLGHLNELRADILVRSQSRQVSSPAKEADVQ